MFNRFFTGGNLKRLLILIPVSIFALGALAVLAFNAGLFHSQIEELIAAKTGSKVQLGSTTLVPKWPLRLELGATEVVNPLGNLKWEKLTLELASVAPPYAVTLTLDTPVVEVKPSSEKVPQPPAQPDRPAKASASPPALRFALNIRNGEIKASEAHITSLNMNFEQKQLLKSAAKLHLQALVQPNMLPVPIPLALDTDSLTLSRDVIKGSDLKLSLGGLIASASGTSLLTEGRHRWNANVSAPDLSKLPKPPMEIPASDWRGSIQLKVEVVKESAMKPWTAEGDMQAAGVSANIRYKADKLIVQGPLNADLSTHFLYNETPEIKNLKGTFDLSQAHVVYQDVLEKAPNVPLKMSVNAGGDIMSLKIQSLALDVWKFSAKVSGETGLSAPYAANFKFEVPPFSMNGADRVLLPLATSPAGGQVGLSGSWSGQLLNAADGHLNITGLKLKDFVADVNYDKPGVFKYKGPLKASLEAKLEADKRMLLQANVKGNFNATEAALVAGPLRKEAKALLQADIQAGSKAKALEIQNLLVSSFLGKMRVSGRITDIFDPKLQVKLELTGVSLSEMRIAFPDYHDKIPKGDLSGVMALNGTYDKAKPWNEWPLNVDGSLKVALPEYVIESTPTASGKTLPTKGGKGAAKENASFLPPGHLVDNLKMRLVADIGTVKKDKLVLKGAHIDGQVAAARFKGGAKLREIFGGGVDASMIDVPLTHPRPALSGTVKWHNIVIEDAITFAKPEYRDFASGRMAGQTDFMTYLPSDAEFMPFLKAKGEVNAQPVTLNSVKVGEMLNNLIRQLPPMVKMSPVKVDPLKGQLKAAFNLAKQVLQIDSLEARDVDNSELRLKGKVSIPALQGDFAGTFLWAKPQVQGCLLEGNSDATGRMLIPVAIKGDLMHPGLDSLSDLISKLGSKALACEQKKLIEKVKKGDTKQLENDIKKGLQGLFGH